MPTVHNANSCDVKRSHIRIPESRCVIGIDIGTESVRAAVVDLEGRFLGSAAHPITTTHPHPGWAEQSVDEWQEAMGFAVRRAVDESGVDGGSVAGMSVDGTTCTVVLLDKEGRSVRNPILWMDVRATEEAAIVRKTNDPALVYTGGGPVSAEWMPAKLLWLLRHEPASLDRATTIFDLTDWAAYHLTGEVGLNISTASMRWFYNSERGGLPVELYRSIGLEDAVKKMPRRARNLGTSAGPLSPRTAEEFGLPSGVPVAVGGADAPVASIGMGVVEPGKVGITAGSSHVHLALSDRHTNVNGLFGGYPDGLVPGYYLLEGGQVSTGSVFRWFERNFVNNDIVTEARKRNVPVFAVLTERAATVEPGSDGLIILDHFQGNRTPWTDPTSRGVIRGLTLAHTPGHVARAIMEGVAYGSAIIVDRMEASGLSFDEIVMCGGVTKSDVWTRIHADVMGKPISIPEQQQAPLLGSAILAAVGAGIYPNLPSAADSMVRIGRTIEPDAANGERYRFLVDQYRSTYDALAPLSREMAREISAWSQEFSF